MVVLKEKFLRFSEISRRELLMNFFNSNGWGGVCVMGCGCIFDVV